MASLNDLMYAYYSNHSESLDDTSYTADGSVDDPTAGSDIATISELPVGTWDVECRVFITGTTVASLESDNSVFKIDDEDVTSILCPVDGTSGATNLGVLNIRVTLDSVVPISVGVEDNATTDSTYKATIVASRVG